MTALLPLAGTRVLDLGVGMAPALAVKLMVDTGATVTRLEPEGGDPFYEVYPAYHLWHRGKTIATMSPQALSAALADADICVIGGEEHPDLDWRHSAAALAAQSAKLIVFDISGAPATAAQTPLPAVELLAQARSGLPFRMDADHPALLAFPAANYGAALYGLVAVLSALWARAGTGRGEVVSTSLLQGALIWCGSLWAQAEHPTPDFQIIPQSGVRSFVALCSDDVYVHITPSTSAGYEVVFDALKVPQDVRDALAASGAKRPNRDDAEAVMRHTLSWRSQDVLQTLWGVKITAEAVLPPGECWDDPQTVHNDLIRRDAAGWGYVGCPFTLKAAGVPVEAPPSANSAAGSGPLAGVRVVDMGSFAAGPHSSVILGDLGADVIKIERPEGDPMRSLSRMYGASSRGKRSIAVDAKSPEGAAVIRRICGLADIVHHNFRPGVSARLGIDAESLKEENPAIIVHESSAYGPDGPKSQQSGFDGAFQAACGHETAAGGKGGTPIYYPFLIADFGTGALGAAALTLALLMKQKGAGAIATFGSLLNSAVFLMSEVIRSPDGSFSGAPQIDAARLGRHATQAFYKTSDGWIAVAALGEAMARRLATALDLGDQLSARARSWDAREAELLANAFRRQSTEQAAAMLRAAEVWAEPVQPDVAAALAVPGMADIGMVLSSHDDRLGELHLIGRPFDLAGSDLPAKGRGDVDRIGGHSRQILEECGYAEPEIAELFAAKVVV